MFDSGLILCAYLVCLFGLKLLGAQKNRADVRQWSDFVCLFGLKLLGAQKNRLTAVNNFPC